MGRQSARWATLLKGGYSQLVYMSCTFNGSALSIDCAAYLRDRLNACQLMDPLDEYNKMPDWNGASQMRCATNQSYYYPAQSTKSADRLKARNIYKIM